MVINLLGYSNIALAIAEVQLHDAFGIKVPSCEQLAEVEDIFINLNFHDVDCLARVVAAIVRIRTYWELWNWFQIVVQQHILVNKLFTAGIFHFALVINEIIIPFTDLLREQICQIAIKSAH